LRICFFILNVFDYDSRARIICHDILSQGWQLDIIATSGGKLTNFEGAPIHAIPQNTWPSAKRRFIEYNIQAAKIASSLKADIYHAVDLDTLWAAASASKKNGGKLVYESRELYTELLALQGRPIVKAIWRNLERRLIHRADTVVTINSAIADELARRYDIPKPTVVMNVAARTESVQPIDLRKRFDLDCKYILIYQGILRPGQGILRAIDLLVQTPEIGLVFIGDGPMRNEIIRKSENLSIQNRIRFAGMVDPDQLAAYTAGADAGLLLMEPLAMNNRLALPQKLFQYIAAGVPPIVSDLPCLKEIVEKNKLGLVLPERESSMDCGLLTNFLRNSLKSAADNCKTAKDKYNWEIEGGKLLEIYESLKS
jgi:glycosyltransferase involved in cell wall biosynthesis